jgi:hypothetical protein
MAYNSDELRRDRKQRNRRRDQPPLPTREDLERKRRLGADIQELLETTNDRESFAEEVMRITARCGLHTGAEQRQRALRLWDSHWRGRKNP